MRKRVLYSQYRLSQNDLHPLEVFAHEIYRDLGYLFCFVDRGDENNSSVLCSKCHLVPSSIEYWIRDREPVLDYSAFMIAGDLFLELQDHQ